MPAGSVCRFTFTSSFSLPSPGMTDTRTKIPHKVKILHDNERTRAVVRRKRCVVGTEEDERFFARAKARKTRLGLFRQGR